jgi:glycosyltransferase involved in cell wall biosynthesis
VPVATVVIDADVLGRHRTGDESYVSGLLAELSSDQTGLDLAAATRYPALVPDGVRAIAVRTTSQMLRLAVSLPRALRRERAALAHFQYVIPPAWRGPSVITVHDLSFEAHPEFFSWGDQLLLRQMVPRACRRAALVLTVSDYSKADLVDRYRLPEHKVVVTPNGVDKEFGPDGPRYRGPPYLLFVGSLQPRKDPVCAVEALALLDSDLRLVMAGPAKQAASRVSQAIDRLGLGSRVDLLGHVSKHELAKLYRGARCLVFPSRYEGFGLPALEAMACGTPVVAARSSALPEVVGEAGVLFDPGDAAALADGVRRALAGRDRLVAAGFERSKHFRWSDLAATTLAAYKELL